MHPIVQFTLFITTLTALYFLSPIVFYVVIAFFVIAIIASIFFLWFNGEEFLKEIDEKKELEEMRTFIIKQIYKERRRKTENWDKENDKCW